MSEAVVRPESEAAPIPRPVVEQAASRSYVGHARIIGLLTLISRVLGLGREVVSGHFLGAGLVASAFSTAFLIPNLFRKLFGEGALSAAFIPLYAQAVKDERENGSSSARYPAADFAAAGVNVLCAMLLAITVAGEIALIAVLLLMPNLRSDYVLIVRLTAIMLPYVLLICGTAFLSGILQVHRRFAAPAAAPVILNLCHIAVVLIGAALLGLHPHDTDLVRVAARQTTLCYWLAGFVLVAGILQVAVLLPDLRRVGFKFRIALGMDNPLIHKMIALSIPVALGAGVLQLSVAMDKAISVALMCGQRKGELITHFVLFGHSIRYPMELGAAARLSLAQYLYQFPLGIFAIALATAIFPRLSSTAKDKDPEKFRAVLRGGIEAALFEGIPASLGLVLVREPAVKLLFRHGQISAHDAQLISQSVLFYAAGIWAFSLLQIVNRAYYALHNTTTPLVMSGVNLAINIIVEIPLLWWLGESGMAVGTLASFSVQAILMLVLLNRRVGGLHFSRSAMPVTKMMIATLIMGLACWAVKHVPGYPLAENRLAWTAQLVLLLSTGVIAYAGACTLMRLEAMEHLLPKRWLSRRVPRV